MADTAQAPSDTKLFDQVRLEEFKALRGEVELRAVEQRTMERNVVLLSAAIYAFLLFPKGHLGNPKDEIYLELAWYLPPLFNFLAFMRWLESIKMIAGLAQYLRTIELNGWEMHLLRARERRDFPIVSWWYAPFWLIMSVGSLTLGYLHMHPPQIHQWMGVTVIGIVGTIVIIGMLARLRAWEKRTRLG